jgi:hypothetical protein
MGQQETTNVEVSSGFPAIDVGSEIPGLGFHTAEATGVAILTAVRGCSTTSRPACGRPPAAAVLAGSETMVTGEPASPYGRITSDGVWRS